MLYRFSGNIPKIRPLFGRSMRSLAGPMGGWRLTIEFLHHGQTQSIQGIGSFVIGSALIVAQKGKNQPASRVGVRKTRARSHVLDGTCLRVDVAGAERVFHYRF